MGCLSPRSPSLGTGRAPGGGEGRAAAQAQSAGGPAKVRCCRRRGGAAVMSIETPVTSPAWTRSWFLLLEFDGRCRVATYSDL
jgi:hypothetical protein